MGYQIIRCAVDRSLVIVVSPENARPSSPNTEYYRYVTWAISKFPVKKFHVISADGAQGYFSGHADGLGHGQFPTSAFERLRDVVEWINSSEEPEIDVAEDDHWTHYPVSHTPPTNKRLLVFGTMSNSIPEMAIAWKDKADLRWYNTEGVISFEVKQWCLVPEPGDK